jgi:hypothetical protein
MSPTVCAAIPSGQSRTSHHPAPGSGQVPTLLPDAALADHSPITQVPLADSHIAQGPAPDTPPGTALLIGRSLGETRS